MRMSRRTPLAVLAGATVLVTLAACDSKSDTSSAAGGPIKVEASDTACAVATNTAPAGNVTFEITNRGSKVTEFYLYAEGDRIMGEVESGVGAVIPERDVGGDQPASRIGMIRYV